MVRRKNGRLVGKKVDCVVICLWHSGETMASYDENGWQKFMEVP